MAKKEKRFTKVDPHHCPPVDGEKIRRRHVSTWSVTEIGDVPQENGNLPTLSAVSESCKLCGQLLDFSLHLEDW